MAFPRIGGAGIPLSVNGSQGGTNAITLAAGKTMIVPAGTFLADLGLYTYIQFLDPVTGIWRTQFAYSDGHVPIYSDGANIRLANLTGTPVGALITNAGTGLTNGVGTVTVAPSAGASVWQSVVGGAVNTAVTITAGGNSYVYAPNLIVSAPPTGGLQATATCTIAAGVINAVTVVNQGAGYTSAPTITVVNDPRDTTGNGGILTPALTGSGTLTGLYPTNPGTVLTAVPTFTFSPASTIAATAIMNWTVTAFTATAGGAVYGNAQPFLLLSTGGTVAGTSVLANPMHTTGLTAIRPAQIDGTSTAGGAIQTTGAVFRDGGNGFQAVPALAVIAAGNAIPTTIAVATATVGGVTDTSWLQPI